MVTVLVYLLGLVAVVGVLFLVVSALFGRGEELAPIPPDTSPVALPENRPVSGRLVRKLRLPVVLRGYRMSDVDWVLDRLADQLDERDEQIAQLRAAVYADSAAGGTRAEADPADAPSERRDA